MAKKLFLWDRLDYVTTNWHSEGGLVVVAADEESAKRQIAAAQEKLGRSYTLDEGEPTPEMVSAEDWKSVRIFELVNDPEDSLIVFPDAGCC